MEAKACQGRAETGVSFTCTQEEVTRCGRHCNAFCVTGRGQRESALPLSHPLLPSSSRRSQNRE